MPRTHSRVLRRQIYTRHHGPHHPMSRRRKKICMYIFTKRGVWTKIRGWRCVGAQDTTYLSSITAGHCCSSNLTSICPSGSTASCLTPPRPSMKSFKESPVHERVTSLHLIVLFHGLLCVICAGGGVVIQPYTSILTQVNNYVAAPVKSTPLLITVNCQWTRHFTL